MRIFKIGLSFAAALGLSLGLVAPAAATTVPPEPHRVDVLTISFDCATHNSSGDQDGILRIRSGFTEPETTPDAAEDAATGEDDGDLSTKLGFYQVGTSGSPVGPFTLQTPENTTDLASFPVTAPEGAQITAWMFVRHGLEESPNKDLTLVFADQRVTVNCAPPPPTPVPTPVPQPTPIVVVIHESPLAPPVATPAVPLPPVTGGGSSHGGNWALALLLALASSGVAALGWIVPRRLASTRF